jgi:hypothetical protein
MTARKSTRAAFGVGAVAAAAANVKTVTTLEDLISRAQQPSTSVAFVADVLKEAASEVIATKRKQSVAAVTGLIQSFESTVQSNVSTLKIVREQEATQSKKVKELDRAFRYFAATANPYPMFAAQSGSVYLASTDYAARDFARKCGLDIPKSDDPAWVIPASWTPTTK